METSPVRDRMMQETINTYDRSATKLSEYFRSMRPRIFDIELALELAGNPKNPKVFEIGCGDGRDAAEIVKRTNWYLGLDISKGMIEQAEKHLPDADFEVGDVVSYPFPPDLDVIYAFASLLHVNKKSFGDILSRAWFALKPNGVIYLSLKHADMYKEEVKEDVYGRRKFYLYNPDVIKGILNEKYEVKYINQSTISSNKWFEMALKKINLCR